MKKGFWVSLLAGAAAIAAAAVAVTVFIRKKSKALSEHLDYDPDEYFENDEDGECCCGQCCEGEDSECCCEEEETIPLHPDETAAVESEAVPDADPADYGEDKE
ncbi:MAG: hypothetical protein ACOX64_10805 [Candidatus Merdivicinus sp.]|mgnify:CR=1 FL=1|jgi:hypothetical protein